MANACSHEARFKFLEESSRLVALQSPVVSTFLGAEYDKLLQYQDGDLKAPAKEWELHRRELCGSCGNTMIPGWSCDVEQDSISPKGQKKKKVKAGKASPKEVEKAMIYACHRCFRKTIQPVKAKPPKHLKRSQAATKVLVEESTLSILSDSAPVSANANSKKRAKARKQGGLQAMLAKSKASSSQRGGFGLDLMDLMK